MPELYIYERGKPAEARALWPLPEGPQALIQEARDYVLELRGVDAPGSVDLFIDDAELEALRPPDSHTARWRWSPGFYAGSVEIRLERGGGRRESFQVVTDPDLAKLTRTDFDVMVREILEDTFALFSLSGFRTAIERGTGGQAPPLARLEFIRSRIALLENAIREIDRHPVRILQAQERTIPYHAARAATPPEIIRSFRSGRINRVPSPNTIHPGFQDLFPERIRKTVRTSGLDIREHQDIKASLKSWAAWLDVVSARLAVDESGDPAIRATQAHWAVRCRGLARRVLKLLKLPLFDSVSDRSSPVTLTSIYRRTPAYRTFFQLYQDMRLGIANITGDFLQMPLARTFDLYELWCFLRLLRAAVARYGVENIEPGTLIGQLRPGSVTIAAGAVTVPIGSGYALCFQREYQEYWRTPDRLGSFSRTMRPDVGLCGDLHQTGQSQLIVLDAKYRIERSGLGDALGSLHMYRDALVSADEADQTDRMVIGAYILTPQVPPDLQKPWKETTLPGRLFHPDYRSTFRFGAATLRPGQTLDEVADTLEAIIQDSGATIPIHPPSQLAE